MDSRAIINQYQLGSIIRECRQGWISPQVRPLLFALLIVMPVFWGFLGQISLLSFQVILVPIGVIVLLCAVGDSLLNRNNTQIICEQGLLDICRGKVKVARYEQIKEVWTDVTKLSQGVLALMTLHNYRIKTHDNAEIVSHFPAVGEWLRQEITDRLLPEYRQAYQTNRDIAFGKLVISCRGMTHGKLQLSWSELHSYGLNQGLFYIRQYGNNHHGLWMTQQVSETPNIDLLLAFLAERHGPSQPMNP
jgi:hypothetical protein